MIRITTTSRVSAQPPIYKYNCDNNARAPAQYVSGFIIIIIL